MKNFKKLSREELKSVNGGLAAGKACKLVVNNGDGTYTTYNGTCDTTYTAIYDSLSDSFHVSSTSYCNTGDGVAHTLASNGGSSRC